MRTVNEMLKADRKYQVVSLPQVYEKSFAEIEKILRADEDVLCAFTGSSAQRKNMETFETEAGTYIINTNMIKYVYKRNDDNAA